MISKLAVVETKEIGTNVQIGHFCVINKDVTIGDNVIIHHNVIIEPGVIIGNNVEIFPGAYIGKKPKGAGAVAREPNYEKIVSIGDSCSIGPHSTIYYDVFIGNNTLIGDNASIREKCVIGEYCIISRCVTINYNVKIGNRTKIMDLTHITGNCEIGDDVFISVLVKTTNDNAIGKLGYESERIIGPKINNGVLVGAGANLLPRITIGENSIVGASSVVSKDVPPAKLVIGSPARIIKSLD